MAIQSRRILVVMTSLCFGCATNPCASERTSRSESTSAALQAEGTGTSEVEAPPAEDPPPDGAGFLGVSSSPPGVVYVNGHDTGELTPVSRIPLTPGLHTVHVYYEDLDSESEPQSVNIREGVRTSIFFRPGTDSPNP